MTSSKIRLLGIRDQFFEEQQLYIAWKHFIDNTGEVAYKSRHIIEVLVCMQLSAWMCKGVYTVYWSKSYEQKGIKWFQWLKYLGQITFVYLNYYYEKKGMTPISEPHKFIQIFVKIKSHVTQDSTSLKMLLKNTCDGHSWYNN